MLYIGNNKTILDVGTNRRYWKTSLYKNYLNRKIKETSKLWMDKTIMEQSDRENGG